MASAHRKDIARTVRGNLKRFISIAVICANTAIINTLNAEISSIESASAQLESRVAGLQEQIAEVRSEENVIQFAEEMGMVLRP